MGDEDKIGKRAAYIAVLMMGIVSMLGNICYESGRGIAPDYLRFLGTSAFMVGAVIGAGEFIGYAARLLSGPLADRSIAYGVFNTALGVGTLLGSAIFSLLIDRGYSSAAMLDYAVVTQVGALAALRMTSSSIQAPPST